MRVGNYLALDTDLGNIQNISGKIDVVSVNFNDPTANGVSVFSGQTNGSFAFSRTLLPPGGKSSSYSAGFGRVNYDNFNDIIVVYRDPDPGLVVSYLAQADGSYSAPIAGVQTNAGNTVQRLGLFGDLNGDSLTDVAVATNQPTGGYQICVLLAPASGSGVYAPTLYIPTNAGLPNGYARGLLLDLNRDGHLDYLGQNDYCLFNLIQLAPFNGTVWAPYALLDPSPRPVTGRLASGDMNHDNLTDLVVRNTTSPALALALYFGRLAPPYFSPPVYVTVGIAGQLTMCDFGDADGDGDQDLFCGLGFDTVMTVFWIENEDGLGTFTTSALYPNAMMLSNTPFVDHYEMIAYISPITGQTNIVAGFADVGGPAPVPGGLVSLEPLTPGGEYLYSCVQCFTMLCLRATIDRRTADRITAVRLPAGRYIGCGTSPIPIYDQRMTLLPERPGDQVIIDMSGCSTSTLFTVPTGQFRSRLTLINITIIGAAVQRMPLFAVSGTGSTLELVNVHVVNVTSFDAGGFLAISDGGRLEATDCSFTNVSTANSGGVIAALGASAWISLTRCQFTGCRASGAGGAIFAQTQDSIAITTDGCVFINNTANMGGALAVFTAESATPSSNSDFGVFTSQPPRSPAFEVYAFASTFRGNTARFGGVFLSCGVGVTLNVSSYAANTAQVGRIAFFCLDNPTTVWDGPPSPIIVPYLTVDSGSAAVLRSFGIGTFATSPATLTVLQTLPSAVMPGARLGTGVVALRDAFSAAIPGGQLTIAVGAADGTALVDQSSINIVGVSFPVTSLANMVLSPISFAYCDKAVSLVVGYAANPGVLDSIQSTQLQVASNVFITRCPAGFGRGTVSPFTCIACPPGAFADGFSLAPCAIIPDCAVGSARSANITPSFVPPCVCLPDYYAANTTTAIGVCTPCPTGGVCLGGSNAPYAQAGYFDVTNGKGTGTTASPFVECVRPKACAGGPRPDKVCNAGYTGFMCNVCQSGYYATAKNECQVCPSNSTAVIVVFLLLIALGVGVIVILTAVFLRVDRDDRINDYALDSDYVKARHPRIPYSIRTALMYAQTVGLLLAAGLPWPNTLRRTMEALDTSNLSSDVFALQCTLKSFTTKYFLLAVIPAAMALVVAVAVFGLSLCFADLEPRDALRRLYFMIAPMMFLPLSLNTLVLFDCSKLSNGSWYLDVDLGTRCYNKSWRQMLPVGIVAILVYVIFIPVSLFAAVFSQRHTLRSLHTLRVFGSLYRSYRSSYAYMESFHLSKRLALVMTTVFLSNSKAWQLIIFQAVLLTTVAVHMRAAPLYKPQLNSLEAILHLCLSLLAMLGFVFLSTPSSAASFTMLVILAVGITVGGLAVALSSALKEVQERRRILAGTVDAADMRLELFKKAFQQDAADWVDPQMCAAVSRSLGWTEGKSSAEVNFASADLDSSDGGIKIRLGTSISMQPSEFAAIAAAAADPGSTARRPQQVVVPPSLDESLAFLGVPPPAPRAENAIGDADFATMDDHAGFAALPPPPDVEDSLF